MKTFTIDSSIKGIKFDDVIEGTFTKAVYTHDEIENKTRSDFFIDTPYHKYKKAIKVFHIFHKINGKWEHSGNYCKGLDNAKIIINTRDLSIFRTLLETNKLQIKE